MTSSPILSRRALIAGAAAAFAGGCGRRNGAGADTTEVAVFQGGYGIDFFQNEATAYEARQPGTKLNVWGNPRIWEQLRPRFVAGNPPDLTWPGWGMDYWALIYESQVQPLDSALAGPPDGGDGGAWRDTFEPSLLKLGQYQGKQYMMPYHYNVEGWWYNPDLFTRHGWKPPQTWSQLLALCPEIKAAGIAPLTFQGKYPYYMTTGFLFPWVISAGGVQAFNNAQDLVPGGWKSPAFLKAAQMIDQLRSLGYFEKGATGMTHTESQMEFVSGRAAMIPCGTWLHSEMSKVMPSGFRMAFMLPPVLDAGPGDPTNICIGIEPWIVPRKARHQATGIDFFRYLTSRSVATRFVEQKGTLMSIKDSTPAQIPDYLAAPAAAFKASKAVWSVQYSLWYQNFGTETQNAMAALLEGQATPQQFVDRLEAAAAATRQDSTIPKHTVATG